ncbi:Uncharacterized protein GBIM_04296, partial [Gryllus bimaculatus]
RVGRRRFRASCRCAARRAPTPPRVARGLPAARSPPRILAPRRPARGGNDPKPPPSPHASPSAAAAALGVDDFEDDGSARSERSTNLSALYGPGLPRRMFINDRHLQILPDGTVNGTHDQSDHSKFSAPCSSILKMRQPSRWRSGT